MPHPRRRVSDSPNISRRLSTRPAPSRLPTPQELEIMRRNPHMNPFMVTRQARIEGANDPDEFRRYVSQLLSPNARTQAVGGERRPQAVGGEGRTQPPPVEEARLRAPSSGIREADPSRTGGFLNRNRINEVLRSQGITLDFNPFDRKEGDPLFDFSAIDAAGNYAAAGGAVLGRMLTNPQNTMQRVRMGREMVKQFTEREGREPNASELALIVQDAQTLPTGVAGGIRLAAEVAVPATAVEVLGTKALGLAARGVVKITPGARPLLDAATRQWGRLTEEGQSAIRRAFDRNEPLADGVLLDPENFIDGDVMPDLHEANKLWRLNEPGDPADLVAPGSGPVNVETAAQQGGIPLDQIGRGADEGIYVPGQQQAGDPGDLVVPSRVTDPDATEPVVRQVGDTVEAAPGRQYVSIPEPRGGSTVPPLQTWVDPSSVGRIPIFAEITERGAPRVAGRGVTGPVNPADVETIFVNKDVLHDATAETVARLRGEYPNARITEIAGRDFTPGTYRGRPAIVENRASMAVADVFEPLAPRTTRIPYDRAAPEPGAGVITPDEAGVGWGRSVDDLTPSRAADEPGEGLFLPTREPSVGQLAPAQREAVRQQREAVRQQRLAALERLRQQQGAGRPSADEMYARRENARWQSEIDDDVARAVVGDGEPQMALRPETQVEMDIGQDPQMMGGATQEYDSPSSIQAQIELADQRLLRDEQPPPAEGFGAASASARPAATNIGEVSLEIDGRKLTAGEGQQAIDDAAARTRERADDVPARQRPVGGGQEEAPTPGVFSRMVRAARSMSPFKRNPVTAAGAKNMDDATDAANNEIVRERLADRVEMPEFPGEIKYSASTRRPETGLGDDLDRPTWMSQKKSAMTRWEGARSAEARALNDMVEDAHRLAKKHGIDLEHRSSLRIQQALHGEASRESLSDAQKPFYDAARQLADIEDADIKAFLSMTSKIGVGEGVFSPKRAEALHDKMMQIEGYFPRIFKSHINDKGEREFFFNKRGPGQTPGFAQARGDETFTDMVERGAELLTNDPVLMMALRRQAGVEWRETIVFMNRLRVAKKLIKEEEAAALGTSAAQLRGEKRPIKAVFQGWRTPDIQSPIFRGAKVYRDGKVVYEGPRYVVPPDVANFMEAVYGQRTDVVSVTAHELSRWARRAKRLKLAASLFQHLDFASRTLFGAVAGIPETKGMSLIRYPSLAARLVQVSIPIPKVSGAQRAVIKKRMTSNEEAIEGSGVTWRMLSEEGWSVQDSSILQKEFLQAVEDAKARRGGILPPGAAERIKATQEYFEGGLFEGVYPHSMMFALENFILPQLLRKRKGWTSRQVAAEAAEQVNIMFGTIGKSQSLFKSQVARDLLDSLIFSTNETETLMRQAVRTFKGPNKELWQRYYSGMLITLAGIANAINFVATGKPMPADAYIPINLDDPHSSIFGVGYNNRFMSPQIPLVKGRDGGPVYLDIVGQMDTVLRFLNPSYALASRLSVPARVIRNQVAGEDFWGMSIVGDPDKPLVRDPQEWRERGTQLVKDFAPIIGLQALGGDSPKLGASAALEVTGVNLRSEGADQMLERVTRELGYPVDYSDLEPYEKRRVREEPTLAKELSTRAAEGAELGRAWDKRTVEMDKVTANYHARLQAAADSGGSFWEIENARKSAGVERYHQISIIPELLGVPFAEGDDHLDKLLEGWYTGPREKASETGVFEYKVMRREQANYLRGLSDADKELMYRNINIGSENFPEKVRKAMRSKNYKKWNEVRKSEAARARHDRLAAAPTSGTSIDDTL